MRILLCSPKPLKRELGCSKNLVELAEELEKLGWKCDLIDDFYLLGSGRSRDSSRSYSEALRKYLEENSCNYDVVLYEHLTLPYLRSVFSEKALMVARPALLLLHLEKISIPIKKKLKTHIKDFLLCNPAQRMLKRNIANSLITLQQADLVQALNNDDKAEIISRGVVSEKVIVVSNGIDRDRRILFNKVSVNPPVDHKIAFVGTFDFRKGALDLPKIVNLISASIPQVKFRLLGTSGLYRTEEKVLEFFPKHLRRHLEITPSYPAHELPKLLADCSVGVFPSYLEGFPFGVLEMLSASIPVFAYDAPGPSMMLGQEYLMPVGDFEALGNSVVKLLNNPQKLAQSRMQARERSQYFSWERTARELDVIYLKNLEKKRNLTGHG
jgi:glycosyltransferase involved in cell wall biosynthesis